MYKSALQSVCRTVHLREGELKSDESYRERESSKQSFALIHAQCISRSRFAAMQCVARFFGPPWILYCIYLREFKYSGPRDAEEFNLAPGQFTPREASNTYIIYTLEGCSAIDGILIGFLFSRRLAPFLIASTYILMLIGDARVRKVLLMFACV